MQRTAVGMLVALSVGLGVSTTGCAVPEASEPNANVAHTPPPAVGLFAGESMQFEVSLAGILVGQAQLAVGQPGIVDGRPAIAVSSRITAAGVASLFATVDDDAGAVIDLATWRPMTISGDATYNTNHVVSTATFDGARVTATYQRNQAPLSKLSFDLRKLGGVMAYDAHSAMALVRTWDAAPGEQTEIWMVGGKRLWHSTITYIGPATIGTVDGNRAVLRFDGTSQRMKRNLAVDTPPARTFSVWLSDDADRVPVRMLAHTELGDVEMVLTAYSR